MIYIAHKVVWVSWAVFLLSFFLPATNILEMPGTPPGTPLSGWQAFEASLTAGVFNFWAWLGDIRVLAFALFPFSNAIMLVAPACSHLRQYSFVPALVLVPAAMLPWLLPHYMLGDLYVGFYAWNISHLLMSLSCCLLSIGYATSDPSE